MRWRDRRAGSRRKGKRTVFFRETPDSNGKRLIHTAGNLLAFSAFLFGSLLIVGKAASPDKEYVCSVSPDMRLIASGALDRDERYYLSETEDRLILTELQRNGLFWRTAETVNHSSGVPLGKPFTWSIQYSGTGFFYCLGTRNDPRIVRLSVRLIDGTETEAVWAGDHYFLRWTKEEAIASLRGYGRDGKPLAECDGGLWTEGGTYP